MVKQPPVSAADRELHHRLDHRLLNHRLLNHRLDHRLAHRLDHRLWRRRLVLNVHPVHRLYGCIINKLKNSTEFQQNRNTEPTCAKRCHKEEEKSRGYAGTEQAPNAPSCTLRNCARNGRSAPGQLLRTQPALEPGGLALVPVREDLPLRDLLSRLCATSCGAGAFLGTDGSSSFCTELPDVPRPGKSKSKYLRRTEPALQPAQWPAKLAVQRRSSWNQARVAV